MSLTKFHPVYVFLVCFKAVAEYVEPPANVTLHCHNLHNVVEWSYGHFPPGLKFKVFIGGLSRSPNKLWVDPPILRADVSHLSDPRDDYYLTVTAVIGQNESDAAPPDGILFSYFMDSPVEQKCFVDFPSLNVTVQRDGKVLFHFMHPWLMYHHKLSGSPKTNSRKKISFDAQNIELLPEFKYDVVINNEEQSKRFFCEESVCEGHFSVAPAQEKHCLKVTGEMQKMSIKGTQAYCALSLEETSLRNNGYIYIIVLVSLLTAITVALVLFMLYRKKTKPSSYIPNSIKIKSQEKPTLRVDQESVFVPEMGSASPTPLLSTPEEEESKEITATDTLSTETVLRLPIGVPIEDEGVCDVVEAGNDEGAGYTHGKNLDEDETQSLGAVPSGYEKRPVFVELAPDDQAEGYRG